MAGRIEKAIRHTVEAGVLKLAAYNRSRMAPPAAPHPYLSGLNAPMDRELTLTDLVVDGVIPPDLDGRYLRIGPNPVRPPAALEAHHWFVGDGMVHGLRIAGGRALWYRNRWIRSRAVSQALGEPEVPGPRHFSDTVNTHVVAQAGRTWALVEAGGYPVRLGDELQTLAHDNFDGSLRGSFSAHPHRHPATGELHAICYEATDPDRIRHVVVGSDGRVRREEPIAVRHGPSVHDCMITARHILVLDLPVTFSMQALVAGYSFPYAWNPAHRARVGVLALDAPGDTIAWCDVDPCYVFHPANACETADGRIVLDVVAHATMFAHSRHGPDAEATAFERWTVDPAARRVDRRVVDPTAQEFPRIDERFTAGPHRWVWTAGLQRLGGDAFVGARHLIRHDLQTGARDLHDFGAGRHVGEFVFVPRRDDAPEGDGWLMGLVVDGVQQTTDFVILDAQRFGGAPQAVVRLPHRIPAGFHGNWLPTAAGEHAG
jgi:carotenoid cleavage dioxygenase